MIEAAPGFAGIDDVSPATLGAFDDFLKAYRGHGTNSKSENLRKGIIHELRLAICFCGEQIAKQML
jgi:hypothetical protein